MILDLYLDRKFRVIIQVNLELIFTMSKDKDKDLNWQLFLEALEAGKLLASQIQSTKQENQMEEKKGNQKKRSRRLKEVSIDKLKQLYQKI